MEGRKVGRVREVGRKGEGRVEEDEERRKRRLPIPNAEGVRTLSTSPHAPLSPPPLTTTLALLESFFLSSPACTIPVVGCTSSTFGLTTWVHTTSKPLRR